MIVHSCILSVLAPAKTITIQYFYRNSPQNRIIRRHPWHRMLLILRRGDEIIFRIFEIFVQITALDTVTYTLPPPYPHPETDSPCPRQKCWKVGNSSGSRGGVVLVQYNGHSTHTLSTTLGRNTSPGRCRWQAGGTKVLLQWRAGVVSWGWPQGVAKQWQVYT